MTTPSPSTFTPTSDGWNYAVGHRWRLDLRNDRYIVVVDQDWNADYPIWNLYQYHQTLLNTEVLTNVLDYHEQFPALDQALAASAQLRDDLLIDVTREVL